jgi:hypothetical protein
MSAPPITVRGGFGPRTTGAYWDSLPVESRRRAHSAGRDLPAAVLADMLHIHPNTATRWVETAGGNWTNYAAIRVSHPEQVRGASS